MSEGLPVISTKVKCAETYANFVDFFTKTGPENAWFQGFQLAFLDGKYDVLRATWGMINNDSEKTEAAFAYISCYFAVCGYHPKLVPVHVGETK